MAQTYTPNTVVVFHCGGCTEQVDVTEGGVFINQLFQVANERETCSSSVAIMASFGHARVQEDYEMKILIHIDSSADCSM